MEGKTSEPIAKDGNCLFRSISPFLAFKIIHNNLRLLINAVMYIYGGNT
jgi:hypothetical protein